jgi:uncharacterized repeat protein (TIGR03803 family)
MHAAGKRCPWSIFDAGPTVTSTKLAASAIRVALTLAALSALTLIAHRPAQAQTETVLYNFNSTDGDNPTSGLTSDGKDNFYGTTPFEGDSGDGTVFELSPNGSGGWIYTVIHSFSGADGADPYFNVIFDGAGNLYGTTLEGGPNGRGVVFELTPDGMGWSETVLYSPAKGQPGSYPQTGLIMDPAGNLYGATLGGVFELSPSGGGWTARKICSVAAHDAIVAGLTMDAAGNIFGNSQATVFELTPNGKGGWLKHVLHKFTGSPSDGAAAEGTPVLDQVGNIYGTTEAGGLDGYGTVYEVSPEKHGKWTERILYFFEGGTSDGYSPFGGIVFDVAGNIYGTTGFGGTSNGGTVFELTPSVGGGSYSEQVLWNFNGTDGEYPHASLVLDAGKLYGTTYAGGPTLQGGCTGDGCGVVFEVTP